MSTFLQLVNLARMEAGVASGDLATLQSGLSQESARFKTWVAREWKSIQSAFPNWKFLRQSGEFTTTANQAKYTGAQAGAPLLADWLVDTFRVSTPSAAYADEAIMGYVPWDTFRNMYLYGAMRSTRSKPVAFSVDPQRALYLGATPDSAYTIGFDYYRTPQELTADADEPLCPERYHDLIAYRALRAYGIFMSAPEVIGRADQKIDEMYPDLCNDQLPPMMAGNPLA